MNRGAQAGVIATCTVLLVGAGFGAYNFLHAVTNVAGSAGPAATAISTQPPTAAEALKQAQSFLGSWQSGPAHYDGAAGETNDPADAKAALAAYATGLKLSSVDFSAVAVAPATADASTGAGAATGPGTATGTGTGQATKVTFTVTAKVAGGTWTYPSALDVLKTNGGSLSVQWAPAVLYPKLQVGQTLAAGAISVAAGDVTVVDRKGVPLTAAKYPELADIISQLKTKEGSRAVGGGKGGAGTGVDLVDSGGTHVGNAVTFTAPVGAKLYTTLDAKIQAQAERAVNDSHITGKSVGVVAIDHASGGIRAIAFSGSAGDIALVGKSAPGSTMKIISAATLIDKGGKTPASTATCTPTIQVSGNVLHNMDGEGNNQGSTMEQAFKESCNTAFIRLMDHAWDNASDKQAGLTALSDEARDVFGIGTWNIGVASNDGSMPPVTGTDPGTERIQLAENTIGQGKIEATPLLMASVGATVADGRFRQPILVPGLPQPSAATPMRQSTAQYLRQMMAATAAGGTAAARLGGMGPSVGAKTGTAEVDGQPPNGWFVGYDSTLSVAAEVLDATTGADTAGYVVTDILKND